MPTPEQFLSKRQRYQPVAVPQHVSEEDMARDWTLSDSDRAEIRKHRTSFRLFVAIQLCAVRLYGRFFTLVQHFAVTIGQPTEKKVDDGIPTTLVHFSALICKGLTV